MRPRRIGLTGGIGSGKSTVARLLAERGARVIDTDAIARALTAPGGAALPPIVAAFGPEMVDAQGALDRARMRALVFRAPEAKQQLEAILHPMIGEATDRQAAATPPAQPIVFDVPLLVETGARWRARVDRVLLVDCSETTQEARVQARSGWPTEQIRQVIHQQASRIQRRSAADAVLLNEGLDLAGLATEVDALWNLGFFGVPAAIRL
ncbi:dephospho-CoA kinase [Ideonella sp. B7]|uniref:dephospho-CoA kinase n=1 Tax=Ideonella benzenivorans TaxID=2831643 RepID=UPI001CED878E|nr:dephospho-CoA kinase [Ideonella benzenivorans]MCA6218813.1 dephospho-CoA kinase [Ideonella benzenivorans]